ncbi:MAG TPA: DoxX family protein [Caulobacteraceae bacterium]|jgi:putative oxidoreductase
MNLDALSPKVLSLLRFVSGLLFMEHGMQKILHFPPQPPPAPAAAAAAAAAKAAGAAVAHAAPWFLKPAGYIELIGGALILLGLFTRGAAFICSGEMAFAYFMSHAPKNFYPVNNGGDPAILYCFLFLFFVFSGPGPFSVDALMKKRI